MKPKEHIDDINDEDSDEIEDSSETEGKDEKKQEYIEDEEDKEKDEESTEESENDIAELDENPATWKAANILEKVLEKAKIKKVHSEQQEKVRELSVEDPLGVIGNLSNNVSKGLNPYEDGFNPALYLATFHNTTEYQDLLGKARKNVTQRQEQQHKYAKNFVKVNMGKFISTKDNLEEIFMAEDSLPKSKWISELEVSYRHVQRMSATLFQPMVLTMKNGKELQSMSNVMDRLRFVLNISNEISDGIKKEEYKRVVNEYRKAKMFLSESKQQIFINMFKKIKQQIKDVTEKLFEMLKDPNLPYDEKQRIVSYLTELDPLEDPSWFFLRNQCACVNGLLTTRNQTEELLHHHYFPRYEKAVNLARLIEQEDRQVNISTEEFDKIYFQWNKNDPTCTSYVIIDACSKLIDHLPNFWKHAKTILDEKFIFDNKQQRNQKRRSKKVQMEELLLMQQRERDKREADMESIFVEIISTYSNAALEALEMMDNGCSHQPQLLESLWELIHCNEYIQNFSGIPPNYIATLNTTTSEIKHLVLEKVGTRCVSEIRCLYVGENWELIREGPHTKLYLFLRAKILTLVRGLMWFITTDNDLNQFKRYIVDSFLAFADTLYHLTNEANMQRRTATKIIRNNSVKPSQLFIHYDTTSSEREKIKIEPIDQKLLLILSNCQYMKKQGMNNIIKTMINTIKTAKSGEVLQTDLIQTERTDNNDDDDDDDDDCTNSSRHNPRKKLSKSRNNDHDDDDDDDDDDRSETTSSSRSSSRKKSLKSKNNNRDNDDDDDDDDDDQESFRNFTDNTVSRRESIVNIHNTIKININTHGLDNFVESKELLEVFYCYEELEGFVFDSYLRCKTITLAQYVKKGIYVANFHWSRAPRPTEVRPYVIELLMDLALLHHQTEIITDEFTTKVFSSLNERLAELFWEHIINGIEGLGTTGATQLDIEISFLNIALSHYETDRSNLLYSRIGKHLRKCCDNEIDNDLKIQLIDEICANTRMQFACFELPGYDWSHKRKNTRY